MSSSASCALPSASNSLDSQAPPLHRIENHDEAFYIWRDAGIRAALLVHIDAHHDMWRIRGEGITIANFICAALEQDIVREVCWVVPDRSISDRRARGILVRQLRSLAKDYGTSPRSIEILPDRIRLRLNGRLLTVAAMSSLDFAGQRVLLDIDVDYFAIPQIAHARPDTHSALPWRWPDELIDQIRAARLEPEMITIAHSVDGCYTPLAWKYLGEELECRLRGSIDSAGYDRLREGSLCAARGDMEKARTLFTQAIKLLPDSAAPHYHLALLSARAGRLREAQSHSCRALEIDPSYQNPFNSLGLRCLWRGRWSQAEAEFRWALGINPADFHAMAGLARVAIRRRKWADAAEWSDRSLALWTDNLDAHRCLAQACARGGRLDDAIEHYERSLSLALHGQKPLSWHILTCTQPARVIDEDHWLTYADLGRLLALRGDSARAISCYQIAFTAGLDHTRDRLRLARLYVKTGQRREAVSQLAQAARQLPRSLKAHSARVWRRARLHFENFLEDRGLG